MTQKAQQFPYYAVNPAAGPLRLSPTLPLVLSLAAQPISVFGLLDSGAAVNVLPYDVGVQLGADWDLQTTQVQLTGNLAQQEARGLVVTATIGLFAPVRLVFAWTKSNAVPLLLGQMNFFLEFEVCFFRAKSLFEVKPK
jgi:hypothetical protein